MSDTRPADQEVALEESARSDDESAVNDIFGFEFQPQSASNLLLWLILGFFVVFILWAAITELDRTVRGEGRVIPSSRMQVVSNLEGGIVDAILVNVGDEVEDGQPLIRLDRTATAADLDSNQARLNALTYKIARLQAEIEGREPRFPEPANDVAASQIAIERDLYNSRRADLASATSAARAQIAQARRLVSEARSSYAARVAVRDTARMEVDLLRPLVERGIEPRFSLIQAENRYSVATSEASAASAAISRAQSGVTEAQARLNQIIQDWRAQAGNELANVRAQQTALQEALPALADRAERTVVRAPLSGRINRVMTATVGGTVRPGDPIVEIVPSEEGLIIEASISPSDIGQVRLEQEAQVSLSAYNSVVYGSLDGRVITISPDTSRDELTGIDYYTVRVVTEGDLLDGDGNPVVVGPGMTAEVSILGEKQSILDYILTPITRLGRSALRE